VDYYSYYSFTPEFLVFPPKNNFFLSVETKYFQIKIFAFRKPKNPVFAHIFSFVDNSIIHSVDGFLLG